MAFETISGSSEPQKGAKLSRLLKHLREHLSPRPGQTRIVRLGEIASSGGMLLVLDDEEYYGHSPEDDRSQNN